MIQIVRSHRGGRTTYDESTQGGRQPTEEEKRRNQERANDWLQKFGNSPSAQQYALSQMCDGHCTEEDRAHLTAAAHQAADAAGNANITPPHSGTERGTTAPLASDPQGQHVVGAQITVDADAVGGHTVDHEAAHALDFFTRGTLDQDGNRITRDNRENYQAEVNSRIWEDQERRRQRSAGGDMSDPETGDDCSAEAQRIKALVDCMAGPPPAEDQQEGVINPNTEEQPMPLDMSCLSDDQQRALSGGEGRYIPGMGVVGGNVDCPAENPNCTRPSQGGGPIRLTPRAGTTDCPQDTVYCPDGSCVPFGAPCPGGP